MPLRHDQLLQALRPLSIAKTCVALLQCSSWTCWSSPLVVRKACWLQWPSLKLYGKPIRAYWGRLDVGLVCSVFSYMFCFLLYSPSSTLCRLFHILMATTGVAQDCITWKNCVVFSSRFVVASTLQTRMCDTCSLFVTVWIVNSFVAPFDFPIFHSSIVLKEAIY